MLTIVLVSILALVAAVYAYIKLTTGQYDSNQKMDGKTVIVTGSNTGIGKETALDLAVRGAKVILACRTAAKGKKAAAEIVASSGNGQVFFRQLDLCSFASVRKFVREFTESEDRLDVLINNAGTLAPEGTHLTEDGLEVGWQSNHFGHFLLTMLLLPTLKKSAPSRIVSVSSEAHRGAQSIDAKAFKGECECSAWSIYGENKLANILFTRVLAKELSDSGVTANCLHPGVIVTEFFRNLSGWRKSVVGYALKLIGPFTKTIKQGAQTTIFLAVDPSVTKTTGEYFADCKQSRTTKVGQDMHLANTLWKVSEELTGYRK